MLEVLEVLRRSEEFCSYFVYPDGFYAGSLGSRNTSHFYPHGFEILGGEIPLAAAVAEKMLRALSDGKLAPPEIMSDRYVVYRVPEYLQAYLDYSDRSSKLPLLPYERPPFMRYFPQSRIYCWASESRFVIANLAKGGVVKVFDRHGGRLLLDDSGIIGRLRDGRVATSQWIDFDYECKADEGGWEVKGSMHVVPSKKPFSPLTQLIFRSVLLALGWIPRFSHLLKASIRRRLMLGRRPAPVRFERSLRFGGGSITLRDEVRLDGKVRFARLSSGGGSMVRYVPQSRYFQHLELISEANTVDQDTLQQLNRDKHLALVKTIPPWQSGPQRVAGV